MPKHADYVGQIAQAMSIKYNNRVYEMKRQGTDVVVLSLGEAFFDIPLYPFDDLPHPAIFHYSHSRGIPELREKLARYYREQYDVPVDPDTEILVTAGSKIAIHMAFMAVLNPGDEVLIHEPAWVSYPEQVRLCHGVPVMVPCQASISDMESFVTPRTKAVVLNYPHNPRGKVITKHELAYLHQLAAKHDLFLIADEAYSDFVSEEETFVSAGVLDPAKEHTIVCNSMSKNYGMSGWRIGYIIANPETIFEILKINQHLITCPATILEYYLAEHFDDLLAVTKPQIQEVIQKRRRVTDYMDSLGMEYLPGTATFYIFASIGQSSLNSEEFCTRLLDEHHICTVPGLGYGTSCDRYIRISVGTESMERTLQAIRTIQELIQETSR